MNWTTEKPEFKEDCILVTVDGCNGRWEYQVWQIKKVYWGDGYNIRWFTGDGEKYGDLAHLTAHRYLIMPLLK